MSKRRDKSEEDRRYYYALDMIREKNLPIIHESDRMFKFIYKEQTITFYPYTGWATGIGINDGRGIKNLLKQLV